MQEATPVELGTRQAEKRDVLCFCAAKEWETPALTGLQWTRKQNFICVALNIER